MTGVFAEQKEAIDHMLDGNLLYYALMLVYLMVSSYTVLNMLIGVICEVISEVARHEKEELTLQELKGTISRVAKVVAPESVKDGMDIANIDHEILVSPSVFRDILQN